MFISGKFLQSKSWEDFQKSLNRKIKEIDNSLIIKMPLKFGFSYLYSPKGAVFDFEKIKELAKSEKAVFYRFEPYETLSFDLVEKHNIKKTKDIQPACTQILDLTKSENELLAEMKQKTRYNIRLAEKKGVKIEKSEILIPKSETNSKFENMPSSVIGGQNLKFEKFYALISATYKRQGIRLHPKNYYKALANFNYIFIAYYNNKPLAAAMVNFYEGVVTYLHGGSTQLHKKIMAPYLLHWEIIKHYKKVGAKFYDWWGVDEKKWPGITKFKIGFGGEKICAPGAFDIPLNIWLYKLYALFRE